MVVVVVVAVTVVAVDVIIVGFDPSSLQASNSTGHAVVNVFPFANPEHTPSAWLKHGPEVPYLQWCGAQLAVVVVMDVMVVAVVVVTVVVVAVVVQARPHMIGQFLKTNCFTWFVLDVQSLGLKRTPQSGDSVCPLHSCAT